MNAAEFDKQCKVSTVADQTLSGNGINDAFEDTSAFLGGPNLSQEMPVCLINAINASTGSRIFTTPEEYIAIAQMHKRKDKDQVKKVVVRGNGMPVIHNKPLAICEFQAKYCRVGLVEFTVWRSKEIQEYAKHPNLMQMALSKSPGRSVVAVMESIPSPDVLNRSHACAFVYDSYT